MEATDIQTTMDINRQNLVILFCQQFCDEQGDNTFDELFATIKQKIENEFGNKWNVIVALPDMYNSIHYDFDFIELTMNQFRFLIWFSHFDDNLV